MHRIICVHFIKFRTILIHFLQIKNTHFLCFGSKLSFTHFKLNSRKLSGKKKVMHFHKFRSIFIHFLENQTHMFFPLSLYYHV